VHPEELLWAVGGGADPVDVFKPHRVLRIGDVQVGDLNDRRKPLASVFPIAMSDGQFLAQVHVPRSRRP
jgi:hypothetical protein